MGRYIGRDNPYGIFEKQVLHITDMTQYEYALTYPVADAASILVVSNHAVLEPNSSNVDGYSVVNNGGTIKFVVAPDTDDRIYIIYMGRQLLVPAATDRSPILHQEVANGTKTQFSVPNVNLTKHGVIVFKNQEMQRHGSDFDIISNAVVFDTTPQQNDTLDFYIFGSERSLKNIIEDGSITTPALRDGSVTPKKLNLDYEEYPNGVFDIKTFNGMELDTSGNNGFNRRYAQYQDLGKIIKVRVGFDVTLTNTPDNKIRFKLPVINDNKPPTLYTATIATATSVESGVVRWAEMEYFDLYRQFGVNYISTANPTETFYIDISLEYTTN